MPLAYFLWVRWKSGAKDTFELTQGGYEKWKSKKFYHTQMGNELSLETPTGEKVYIECGQIASHKIVTKQKNKTNPLNNPTHYDNPLN